MEQEHSFLIRVFGLVAAVIIVLGISMTSCTMYETSVLKEMVAAGADPVAARCSVGSNSSDLCKLYFANKR